MMRLSKGSSSPINRRRCLGILASCAATPLMAGVPGIANALGGLKKITWSGLALGANAHITLYTDDEYRARETLKKMLVEIKRLEQYFSLFLERSLIKDLNARGVLNNPPIEFYRLLAQALEISEQSGGRFDPSVQPLFMAFKACARDRAGFAFGRPYEIDERIIEARTLIGWRHIECSRERISFARPGMAITLNGIAQGYITDRATEILKAAGFCQTLVNFGEYNALASPPGQDGWRIQLGEQSDSAAKINPAENKSIENSPGRPVWTLKDGAIAASDKSGYVFDEKLALHHMLDPQSGTSAGHWREVYVAAPNATLADGASTALFATPLSEVDALARKLKLTRVLLIDRDGASKQIRAV